MLPPVMIICALGTITLALIGTVSGSWTECSECSNVTFSQPVTKELTETSLECQNLPYHVCVSTAACNAGKVNLQVCRTEGFVCCPKKHVQLKINLFHTAENGATNHYGRKSARQIVTDDRPFDTIDFTRGGDAFDNVVFAGSADGSVFRGPAYLPPDVDSHSPSSSTPSNLGPYEPSFTGGTGPVDNSLLPDFGPSTSRPSTGGGFTPARPQSTYPAQPRPTQTGAGTSAPAPFRPPTQQQQQPTSRPTYSRPGPAPTNIYQRPTPSTYRPTGSPFYPSPSSPVPFTPSSTSRPSTGGPAYIPPFGGQQSTPGSEDSGIPVTSRPIQTGGVSTPYTPTRPTVPFPTIPGSSASIPFQSGRPQGQPSTGSYRPTNSGSPTSSGYPITRPSSQPDYPSSTPAAYPAQSTSSGVSPDSFIPGSGFPSRPSTGTVTSDSYPLRPSTASGYPSRPSTTGGFPSAGNGYPTTSSANNIPYNPQSNSGYPSRPPTTGGFPSSGTGYPTTSGVDTLPYSPSSGSGLPSRPSFGSESSNRFPTTGAGYTKPSYPSNVLSSGLPSRPSTDTGYPSRPSSGFTTTGNFPSTGSGYPSGTSAGSIAPGSFPLSPSTNSGYPSQTFSGTTPNDFLSSKPSTISGYPSSTPSPSGPYAPSRPSYSGFSTQRPQLSGGKPTTNSVYPSQPISSGYPQKPSFTGYTSTKPPTGNFSPNQQSTSYKPSSGGYTTSGPSSVRPPSSGYPSQGASGFPSTSSGFSSRPTFGGYPSSTTPSSPTASFPSQPYPTVSPSNLAPGPSSTAGYPTSPRPGFPTRPSPSYPSSAVGSGYPSRPSPSLGPARPSVGSPSTRPSSPRPVTTRPGSGYVYNRPTPPFDLPSSSSNNVNNQYVPAPSDGSLTNSINNEYYNPPGSSGSPSANIPNIRQPPTGTSTNVLSEYVPALPSGCAAALKCVQSIYCDLSGNIAPEPVVFAPGDELRRVPTTACISPESGTEGVCCRDPYYQDPWPSANLVDGVDDGQYREDNSFGADQGGSRVRPARRTLLQPLQRRESTTASSRACGTRHNGTYSNSAHLRGTPPLQVDFAEISWQAMVANSATRKLLCGGTILSKRAVLTTAACVRNVSVAHLMVKGGEWKLGVEEEPLDFHLVKVRRIIAHPGGADLAVLVLDEPLRLQTNIGPICLPEGNEVALSNCIATGWGKRVLQANARNAIMNAIDVRIMDGEQCESVLSQLYTNYLDSYSANTFCGFSDQDQCLVDYGSALACSSGPNQPYVLSGIFAWDTGCKDGNQIGGYVAPDVFWIKQVMDGLSASKSRRRG